MCGFFSSPSRAVSAAEASRWGCFEDFLLLAGTGPLSGSLCLQEIQPASKWSHPMVSAAEMMEPAHFSFFCILQSLKDSWNLFCMWYLISQEAPVHGGVWVHTPHDASWTRQVLSGQPRGTWTPKPVEGKLPAAGMLFCVIFKCCHCVFRDIVS